MFNRKEAERFIIMYIGKLDTSGLNAEVYKKRFKEMTDKEFWGKFLQTTHFHRSRSGASLSGGLFSECLAAELKGMQESSVSAGPDLLGLEEDPGDEVGQASGSVCQYSTACGL